VETHSEAHPGHRARAGCRRPWAGQGAGGGAADVRRARRPVAPGQRSRALLQPGHGLLTAARPNVAPRSYRARPAHAGLFRGDPLAAM